MLELKNFLAVVEKVSAVFSRVPRSTFPSSIVGLFVLLALGAPACASGDSRSSYGKGLEAMDAERWHEAIEWLQKAISEEPNAGGRVSVDGRRRHYLPYYQLGLAFYHSGELREASEAWRQAALQGVLPKKRKLQAEVNRYLFDIERRLQERAEEIAAAAAAANLPPVLSGPEVDERLCAFLKQLNRAEGRILALESPELLEVLELAPDLKKQRDNGIEKLQQAREIFERARQEANPNGLYEAQILAVDSASLLEKIVFDATRLSLK